MITEKNISW